MRKRLLSILLCFCMVVTLMPAMSMPAYAADDYPYKDRSFGTYRPQDADPWNFYYRECTSFVAWCLNNRNGVAFTNWYGKVQWGHAKDWGPAARRLGIAVNNTPAVGAVAWSNSGQYGHVAWVSAVSGNSVTVEEYNYAGTGKYYSRTVAASSFSGYIHIKDISPSPTEYSYLDVNGIIDGKKNSNLSSCATVDVYIDGKRVADDVTDYAEVIHKGASYEIKDIKAKNGYEFIGVFSDGSRDTFNSIGMRGGAVGTLPSGGVEVFLGFIKKTDTPYLTYRAHCENKGWMGLTAEKSIAGTTGEDRKLEALKLNLVNGGNSKIVAQVHLADVGWKTAVSGSSVTVGTTGESRAIEAIKLKLEGPMKDTHSICYRMHVQNIGWMNWVKDGEVAGTTGSALRAEAIQIYLIPKKPAPVHVHSMTSTAAKPAGCTANGNKAYWYCSGCKKYFSDSNGTKETTVAAMTIKSLGHDYQNGVCTRCGGSDPNYIPPVVEHTHTLKHIAEKYATCTTDGNKEYWTCSGCGEVFADGNGTKETTVSAMSIQALGHAYENGICTRCGGEDPNYTPPVEEPETNTEPEPAVDPEPTEIPQVHFPRETVYHQGQFKDVAANQWFTKNVAEAFAFNLMKGNSATTFNPYGDVTIAEAVTMAARIHSIYTTGSEDFVQESGNKWYRVYLDYAYQNGVISWAYYNSDVSQKATRAQFAEIFANAMDYNGLYPINTVADNAVPDVKMTDRYAGSVYKLYRAGILTGNDVLGTFSPDSYITRAESAAIVSRMAESNNRMAFTLQ